MEAIKWLQSLNRGLHRCSGSAEEGPGGPAPGKEEQGLEIRI